MIAKLLSVPAVGVLGLAAGLAVGAATDGDARPAPAPAVAPAPAGDEVPTSMDGMHRAMRDRMPEDLAAACDELHERMPDAMAEMAGAMSDMPGGMAGMDPSAMGGTAPAEHDQHHD